MHYKIYLLLFAVLLGGTFSEECHVTAEKTNLVKFISDAPIEEFEGVTDQIDGYLYWEGDRLTEKSDLYFEVDLNTLDTGIGLRNRHMRENYLETEKYPLASFKGKIIKSEKAGGNTFKVMVQGTMSIHGVDRLMSAEGIIQKNGDIYRIQSHFDVKLSHYNIEIPSIMFYKIDETMRLVLDFHVKKIEEKTEANNR